MTEWTVPGEEGRTKRPRPAPASDAVPGGSRAPIVRLRHMTGDHTPSASSLQMARRLIARTDADPKDPATVGPALQMTCTRVTNNLRDALGDDGCTALLARALVRTEPHHKAMGDIRRLDNGGVTIDGVVNAVGLHGVAAVTDAVEAFLAALVDVLGRLIGEDMAIRIMELDAPRARRGEGVPPS